MRKYFEAGNNGDAAEKAAALAIPGWILDGMAPHYGRRQERRRIGFSVSLKVKQQGASDYFITLGEPLHNNVTGDSANLVVPATMTFKLRGLQVSNPAHYLPWHLRILTLTNISRMRSLFLSRPAS